MFGILLSAFNAFAGWLIRSVFFKFLVMISLYVITTEIIPTLIPLLPSAFSVQSAMSNISPSVAYFLNVCQFELGISLVLSAYASRFLIRRLPVIG